METDSGKCVKTGNVYFYKVLIWSRVKFHWVLTSFWMFLSLSCSLLFHKHTYGDNLSTNTGRTWKHSAKSKVYPLIQCKSVLILSHYFLLDFSFWVNNYLSHQVDEFGDGNLSDGFLHAAESLQWRAKAAGKVVSQDCNKVVLATVQVEHQDVLYGVFSGVQQGDRVFTDIHLKIDLQGFICSGENCDEESETALGLFPCKQIYTANATTENGTKAYLVLRTHHWVPHGAKAYSTVSRSTWEWTQTDRGPAHRLLLGNDPSEDGGISHSQM